MHTWMKKEKKSFVDFEAGKKFSAKYIKDNSTILDIGCGDARFFDIVTKEKKCECYGFDIEKSSKKIVQKKGYKFLISLNIKKKFDVISLFEVIEHLDYNGFIKMMKTVDKLLKKKGLLIMSTPNFACFEQLDHFWDNIQHVRPYNKECLLKYYGNKYTLKLHDYFCPIINPIKVIKNKSFGFKPFLNQLFILQKN